MTTGEKYGLSCMLFPAAISATGAAGTVGFIMWVIGSSIFIMCGNREEYPNAE